MYFLRCLLTLWLMCLPVGVVWAQSDVTPLIQVVASNQKQLDTFKEQIDTFKVQIEAQDKRIGDLSTSLSALSTQITWTGVLITAVLAGFGLVGFFTVTSRDKTEAQEASAQWFKQNNDNIIEEIQNLKRQVQKSRNTMDKSVQTVHEAALLKTEEISKISPQVLSQTPISTEAQQQLTQQGQTLEDKPRNQYTAQEHYAYGLFEFQKDNHDSALESFERAIDSIDAQTTPLQIAEFYFAKGVTLGTLNRSDDEIAVYDKIEQLYGADSSPALSEQVAKAMYNKGVALGIRNPTDGGDVAVYEEIKRRYSSDTSSVLREQVAQALNNKGVALGTSDKNKEAIKVYDEIERCYGADINPALREQVAQALFNKALALGIFNQNDAEEVAVYDEIKRRYSSDTSPVLREQVAQALNNKGVVLDTHDKSEEAVKVYDQIERRYSADTSPALRKQVAEALFNKGIALSLLEQRKEAIAVYDEIERRYSADTSPALREQVAQALLNKGITFGKLNQSKDAIAVYDDIVQCYGADTSPALHELVVRALNGAAFNELMLGKQCWSDEHEREGYLSQAQTRLTRALSLRSELAGSETIAMILGNMGYALWLQRSRTEAVEPTRECLALGGKALFDAQLGDAKQHHLTPVDDDYEIMLRGLWAAQNGTDLDGGHVDK